MLVFLFTDIEGSSKQWEDHTAAKVTGFDVWMFSARFEAERMED